MLHRLSHGDVIVTILALPRNHLKAFALISAALSYIVVGVLHFTHQDFFVSMMPPYLPLHVELVWLSGVFEILGGIGLLVPKTRRFSSFGIIALLFAVYPANIHMMLHPELFSDVGSPAMLYARMPFQFVFMAWAWWVGTPCSTRDIQ